MAFTRYLLLCVLCSIVFCFVWGQNNEFQEISGALNSFTMQLLTRTAEQTGEELNLALSPYTVWSLMTIIAEGARGNTAKQLEKVLGIPSTIYKDTFRRSYKSLTKQLLQNSEGVELDISSAIFTNEGHSLNQTYQTLVKTAYDVDVMPINFNSLVEAQQKINSYIAMKTRNKIKNLINIDDLIDAQIVTATTLFFKGQWQVPFNRTATFPDTFYDEAEKPRGTVMMMYQAGAFPYTMVPNNIKAHAVELTYGKGDRMSMIVILPRKGEQLSNVLNQMTNSLPMHALLDALEQAEQEFVDEDVQVFLPRFTITTDFILNQILDSMGIKDVFNSETADLLGMFPHYLYITRVIQEAKIEVNEEGTVASAAAGGVFAYKSPPPKFYANKPFAYFIVDKQTKSIIFAGKVSNPSNLCDSCSRRN